jgi:hypothetical protein
VDIEASTQKMSSESTVRGYREAPDNPFTDYGVHAPGARNPRSIMPTRLIYFDQRYAAELLEHIASASPGRTMLKWLTMEAQLTEADPTGFLRQHDQRAILSQLIAKATDLEVGGIIDLHLPDDISRRTSWAKLHPDQVIAIRGAVTSAKDIQPSSLRLEVATTSVRVYVERSHFLHLNQSYLTVLPITIVGKVRSVPRAEMCTAAIGTLPAPDELGKAP